jgi:hypothetical protein
MNFVPSLLQDVLEWINLQHFGLFNLLVFQPARKEGLWELKKQTKLCRSK